MAKTKTRHVLMAVVMLLTATATGSAFAKEEFDMIGLGGNSCSQLGKSFKKNPNEVDQVYFIWYTGFVSGLNAALQMSGVGYKNVNGVRQTDKMHQLRVYCDEHPMRNFYDASLNDYQSLPTVAPTTKPDRE